MSDPAVNEPMNDEPISNGEPVVRVQREGSKSPISSHPFKYFDVPWPPREEHIAEIAETMRKSEGTLLPDTPLFLRTLEEATRLLKERPNIVDIGVEGDQRLTVVGDVHGQFFDVCQIFGLASGFVSDQRMFLFNGDLIDRGSFGVEILFIIMYQLIARPDRMFVNRGNHESSYCTRDYGFMKECLTKYTAESGAFDASLRLFRALPIGTRVQSSIFVVHGGIWEDLSITLEDIQKMDRDFDFSADVETEVTPLMQALWSDPDPANGLSPSFRPYVRKFGPDRTAQFLDTNKLDFLVRSHEMVNNGYTSHHNDTMCTLFSAPNYMRAKNNGAIMMIAPAADEPLGITMEAVSYIAAQCPETYPYLSCVAI